MQKRVKCKVCRRLLEVINNAHLKTHKMSFQEYKLEFPNSETRSGEYKKKHRNSLIGRKFSEELKKRLSELAKGRVISEETRRKISATQKGRKCTEERKEKLREYYRTHIHHMQGKKHTEEARRKISETGKGRTPWNKGRRCSDDIRIKISKKLKGNKLGLKTRRKMSIAHKGKILSEITKKRIGRAKKGIKKSPEHIRKILESTNKSPNGLEMDCIKLFKENGLPLKCVGDFKNTDFFIAGKVPDFASTNGKSLLIEVFYEYYKIKSYGSIENYKKDRVKALSKNGWKTLFFTYKEIKSNPFDVVEKIKKELM